MTGLYKSECYCTNLRRSANAVSDFYDAALRPSGLTVAQYYLLVNLSRMGGANITHWAERVGLERSTMVRNIKLLEERGLVTRAEGHGKTYALSEAGETALALAGPAWREAQKRMEHVLGAEDAAAVLRIGVKLQGIKSVAEDFK